MTTLSERYEDILSVPENEALEHVVADLDRMRRIASAAKVSPQRDAAIRRALLTESVKEREDRTATAGAHKRLSPFGRSVVPLWVRFRYVAVLCVCLAVVIVRAILMTAVAPAPASAQAILARAASRPTSTGKAILLTYEISVRSSRGASTGWARVWAEPSGQSGLNFSQSVSLTGSTLGGTVVRVHGSHYLYDRQHNEIVLAETRPVASWQVPQSLFVGSSLAADLRRIARLSPHRVEVGPRAIVGGRQVDEIRVRGWNAMPGEMATIYFDSTTHLLAGFDAVAPDTAHPTAVWQARLFSARTMAASHAPSDAFTLQAPLAARVVVAAPQVATFAALCHLLGPIKSVLRSAGTSMLEVCKLTN